MNSSSGQWIRRALCTAAGVACCVIWSVGFGNSDFQPSRLGTAALRLSHPTHSSAVGRPALLQRGTLDVRVCRAAGATDLEAHGTVVQRSIGDGLSPLGPRTDRSITDRSVQWPSWQTWRRTLLMQDYNTRVVVLGTTLLGLAAGTIGSFTLLRKRALMGDALSHATLPGLALAFLLATAWGYSGKTLPVLLSGAAATGVLGMTTILLIRNLTRLKEDAALGIVLSVFFGGGVALLSVAQQTEARAAGLEAFIVGKTASMVASDAWLIACAGLACTAVSLLLFKELKLLCFDEGFALSRGFPVVGLDLLLMGLVVIVTIIGLQAVGLVLMIAMLVIPAAAARFWTERMTRMTWIAAVVGAVSGMIGSAMSALLPRLPSGPMIVLASSALFVVSMFCGPARGVLIRAMRRRRLHRKIDRQHLLRGVYEHLESQGLAGGRGRPAVPHDQLPPVPWQALLAMRSWSARRLRRQIRRAVADGLLLQDDEGRVRLTKTGLQRAARLAHDHRLWELYLITHADVAPSKVDREADRIEHVLDAELIAKLESLLQQEHAAGRAMRSPHPIPRATDPRQGKPPERFRA